MAYDFSNVNSIALLDIELSMIVTNEVWHVISVQKKNKVTGIDRSQWNSWKLAGMIW